MATKDISASSIPELVGGLISDVKEIAAGHATKMRSEVRDELKGLKQYLVKVTIGVGIGVLGAILLAHTLALALEALGLSEWLAYLIASAIALGGGFLLLKRLPGDNKDIDLVPETAIADLKRDLKTLKDEVTEEVKGEPHPAPAH